MSRDDFDYSRSKLEGQNNASDGIENIRLRFRSLSKDTELNAISVITKRKFEAILAFTGAGLALS